MTRPRWAKLRQMTHVQTRRWGTPLGHEAFPDDRLWGGSLLAVPRGFLVLDRFRGQLRGAAKRRPRAHFVPRRGGTGQCVAGWCVRSPAQRDGAPGVQAVVDAVRPVDD